MKGGRKRVIVVTDGDHLAKRALLMASRQLGLRLISPSSGSPGRLTVPELIAEVKRSLTEPIVVMFDDNGNHALGDGEKAIVQLAKHPDVEVIGALAVASNTSWVSGVRVDFSIDCNGQRVEYGVNKDGFPIPRKRVYGDTVDVLRKLSIPVIVGIGDVGKMSGRDSPERASPVTTMALRALMYEWKRKSATTAQPNHPSDAYADRVPNS